MSRREEQEKARPETVEIVPGVLRMELPISMPGLGHVNCYALVDSEGATVVDPGLPGSANWKALLDRLKQAGLSAKHIHTVVVTHSHPDHFGGAARFASESGAEVVAHRNFAFASYGARPAEPEVSVEDLDADRVRRQEAASESGQAPEEPARPAATPNPSDRWKGNSPWGGQHPKPPLRSRMRWRLMRMAGPGSFIPTITRPVEHGDVLEIGGREWFVLHTPGHTEDHICLHDPDSGVFLAGDHVLPTITPHISGLGHARDPLKSFFYSLDRVGEIHGVKKVLPAHGHPFQDLHSRTEAIKRHHFERLEKVKEIGRELGGATVEAYTQRLFKRRSWGPMAESETYAHLEHLRLSGEAESHRDKDEKLIYLTG